MHVVNTLYAFIVTVFEILNRRVVWKKLVSSHIFSSPFFRTPHNLHTIQKSIKIININKLNYHTYNNCWRIEMRCSKMYVAVQPTEKTTFFCFDLCDFIMILFCVFNRVAETYRFNWDLRYLENSSTFPGLVRRPPGACSPPWRVRRRSARIVAAERKI